MASAGSSSESSLGITFGCLYFGLVFTSILWGVGCLQLYLYYENYWKCDRNWLKIYIFIAWVLDTLHEGFVMDETYSYFVKAIANTTVRASITKSFIAVVAVSAFLSAMAEFIFIRRAWYVSNKNWVITGILATSAVALFVVLFVVFERMSRFEKLAQLPTLNHLLIGLHVVLGLTDTLISVVLIWLLWRTRSGIKRTDSIITRLITYTISSGLVTALWAILHACSGKGYSSCIFVSLYLSSLGRLNFRSSLRATPLTSGMSVNLSNFVVTSGVSSSTSSGASHKVPNSTALECHVEIAVEHGSDSQFPDQKVANSDANGIHHS